MTAYGEDDDEVLAHRLLGVGMQVLNDRPVLSRDAIAAALTGSGLEDQPDRVRMIPHPIPMDEISRLWATFSTGYRISVSYDAAVVLIDNTQALRAPLPVLARSPGDLGPRAGAQVAPFVQAVSPPNAQPGARPGDTVTLTGQRLAGVSQVRVSGGALSGPQLLSVATATDGAVTVQMPTASPLPAGIVAITAQVTAADGDALPSNAVPLALVPVLTGPAPLAGTLAGGSVTIQVTCSPPVAALQTVALVVGSQIVAGAAGAAGSQPRTSLAFTLQGFTAGSYVVRLRVDGQDSLPVIAGQTSFDPEPEPGAVVTAITDWESRNNVYLAGGLEWLRGRLSADRAEGAGGPAGDAWWQESRAGRRGRTCASARAARRPPRPVPLRAAHPAAVRGNGVRSGDGGPLRGRRGSGLGWPAHVCPGAQRPAGAGLGRPVSPAATALLAVGRGASGCRAAAGGQPAASRRAGRELHQGP